jgi:hypothetical protein
MLHRMSDLVQKKNPKQVASKKAAPVVMVPFAEVPSKPVSTLAEPSTAKRTLTSIVLKGSK